MPLRYLTPTTSGDFNGSVAGTVKGGPSLSICDNNRQKVEKLSAYVSVDCETSTMTMSGLWQVSNDGSTWVDVTHGTQNATGVVLATGTAGADAVVTKCYAAPEAVYAWKYARFALVNGVATGGASDVYTIAYVFRAI